MPTRTAWRLPAAYRRGEATIAQRLRVSTWERLSSHLGAPGCSVEVSHRPIRSRRETLTNSSGWGAVAGAVRRNLLASAALAGVLVATLSAGGTLPVSDAVAARPGPPRSAVGAPIAWTPCGPPKGLQCARIRVPLDWDHPNGRTISLSVIRHLASKPKQRIGSIIVNPGGPGDSGVALVRGDPATLDAWGDGRFDVVSWDPRGTNASTAVRCFRSEQAKARFWEGASIPLTGADSRHLRRKTTALARRCAEVGGWLLPHISTADSARDLDHLRRLVGDRKLTYVGLSYGTFLGQTYANMFPRRVRAMLLDGIVDPVRYSKGAEARAAGGVIGSDEVFDKFLSLCDKAGPERCALTRRSRPAAERVRQLFARLRRAPIPAPAARPPGELSYGDLLLSQFSPMRNPALWPQDAKDLDAALGGDGSALETEARKWRTPAGWSAATTSAAISCADAPALRGSRRWPQVISRLDRISRLQGRVIGWWLWAPCASWRVRGQDSYRGPWSASTPNPILLIGTRYDPNTAYVNARRSERLLGNAVLLTHDGYGHLSFQDPSACVEKARVKYLVGLITPPKGTVCKADKQPFDPGFG
jgi:pimeloyl-ACP methyl ester carboxylesterase